MPSALWGNLKEMHDQENDYLVDRWEAAYGPVFAFRGFLGGARLMTTDVRAIAHILGHAYDYPKPEFVRDGLASMCAGHDGMCYISIIFLPPFDSQKHIIASRMGCFERCSKYS